MTTIDIDFAHFKTDPERLIKTSDQKRQQYKQLERLRDAVADLQQKTTLHPRHVKHLPQFLRRQAI